MLSGVRAVVLVLIVLVLMTLLIDQRSVSIANVASLSNVLVNKTLLHVSNDAPLLHVCMTDFKNLYHMMSGLVEVNALLVTQTHTKIALCSPKINPETILPMYFYLLSLLEKHHHDRIIHLDHNQTTDHKDWCNVNEILNCGSNINPTPYSRVEAINWFNNTIRSYIECGVPNKHQRKTVLIIHRPRNSRSIINIEEVQQALTSVGGSEIDILDASTTLLYQLCLPLTRPKLLAAHGAALTLFAFFAPPSFRRLELMPFGYNWPSISSYVDIHNPNHLSILLSQNESVRCAPGLQACVKKLGSIAGMSWREAAERWWPCRQKARSCNFNLTDMSMYRIQHFFSDGASVVSTMVFYAALHLCLCGCVIMYLYNIPIYGCEFV
jgi:hypothetical protein